LAFFNNVILKIMTSHHSLYFKHDLFSFFPLDHFRLWVRRHVSLRGNRVENYLWP